MADPAVKCGDTEPEEVPQSWDELLSGDEADAASGSATPLASQITSQQQSAFTNIGGESQESSAANEEDSTPPPPPVPIFSRVQAPRLGLVATDTAAVEWPQVVQVGVSAQSEGQELPPCFVAYTLQLQLVATSEEQQTLDDTPALLEESWQAVFTGPNHFAQVSGLRPGRLYAFRVVCNPVVPPPFRAPPPLPPSPAVALVTSPACPCQPRPPLLVSRARNALKFKWYEPEETGGRQVLAYHLELFPPPQGMETSHEAWVEVYQGTDLSCKVPRLRPGIKYSVRVQAVNSVGPSEFSLVSAFSTQASVPEQPEPPVAVGAGPASLTLAWAAPCDNGAPITEYRLERNDGGEGGFRLAYHGPDCQHEVTGLTSGLSYRFRLTAYNEAGKSNSSLPMVATTAAVPPHSPSAASLVGANRNSVTLSWHPPQSDGGSPVLGYEAELQPKSKAAKVGLADDWLLVYQGAPTACTINGLRAGCSYRVRVRGFSSAGHGQYSNAADVTTAPDVPGPPSAPEATTRTKSSLAVAWRPPEHDGGAAVIAYRLELYRVGPCDDPPPAASPAPTISPDSAAARARAKGKAKLEACFVPVYSGPDTQAEVEGLEAGMEYQLRVYAINSQGGSACSPVCKAATRAAAPLAPEQPQLAGAPSSSAARLRWEAPYCRGAPLTGFTLELAPCPAVPASNGATNGLGANGHADNHEGAEVQSPATTTIAPDSHSQASTSDTDSAEQSRHAASAANGAGHQAHSSQQLAFQVTYSGLELGYSLKELQPHSQYAVRLRAANSAGASDWSTLLHFWTDAAAPSAPSLLHAEGVSASAAQLRWQLAAHDNGSPVGSHGVEYALALSRSRTTATWQQLSFGPADTCQVKELRAGREYMFRVRAINAKGAGPWSSVAAAATHSAPPSPPGPPCVSNRTATSVRVKWAAPEEDNGAAVKLYRLEMEAVGEAARAVYSGLEASARVTDLNPGCTYSFRVSAVNAAGSSEPSGAVGFTTARSPPPPPTNISPLPSLEAADRVVVTVSWTPPAASSSYAECASYEVEATVGDSAVRASPFAAAGPGSIKQTAAGKATGCQLSGLLPGTAYQVRVRCVGADGAGHGKWSQIAPFTTPGTAANAQSAFAADQGNLALEPAGSTGGGAKKKMKRKASGEEQGHALMARAGSRKADTKALGLAMPAAKRRSQISWSQWLRRQWRKLVKWLLLAVLLAVVAWLGFIFVEEYRKNKRLSLYGGSRWG